MPSPTLPRRRALAGLGAGAAALVLRPVLAQGTGVPVGTQLQGAIADFAAGQPVRTGRVTLEIATLVDNGNVVPVAIAVDSPMTEAEHVREIALFTDRNPQREVLRCSLGPRAGRARVATRMRLATSQRVAALARMSDGSVWMGAVDVVVALAACLEGEGS